MLHSFTLSVYFVALSSLMTCCNVCTQKNSNLFFFVPTPRSGDFKRKPVCIPAYRELCPAKSQYGYFKIVLLLRSVSVENFSYS
jgi:hypothetical protein